MWARTDCPGAGDLIILERARTEARVLLTLDKDFWHITPLVLRTLQSETGWAGHASVVTPERILMVGLRRKG